MKKSRKIVLFLVEGITDETSLGLVLSKIIERDRIVRFKVINGDITAENGVNSSNILSKITNKIKEFIDKDIYVKKDIQNIVHLVDTDGAYIDSSSIMEKNIEGVEYESDSIFTKNIESIKKRNEQKSHILNRLIGTDKVYTDLPYRIYFFSSNLEHVLHNNQSVSDNEKRKYANIFEDKFALDPKGFIEFMNSIEFAVKGDYGYTWDFIKKDANSLKRYTNFQLYLNGLNK